MGAIRGAVLDSVVWEGVDVEGGVGVDSEEVAGALDHLLLLLGELREDVSKRLFEGLRVIPVGPWATEPPENEVVGALDGSSVLCRLAYGLEVVPAVLEGNFSLAFEFLMVPFGDLGVGKKGVVATEETLGDTLLEAVGWPVVPNWVACVLPIALP